MDTNQDECLHASQRALSDLLRTRRSVRRYSPLPVAKELVDAMLEAAIAAPSAHNRQPWRFVIIEAISTKTALAQAMGARLREDRLRDGDALETIEADVARSHVRLTDAPVLVLVCMSMADMDRYADAQRAQAERTMAVQGTAMATQNLLLCAHAAGLAACWMCAPLFCPEAVSAALALPYDWEPQAIVTLGYPAEAGKPYRRRALAELTRYLDRKP
jgi:coenzyme F420-0:L-glutamate ligase/coenzyme F420-1:gamma-L-glutamate ligase